MAAAVAATRCVHCAHQHGAQPLARAPNPAVLRRRIPPLPSLAPQPPAPTISPRCSSWRCCAPRPRASRPTSHTSSATAAAAACMGRPHTTLCSWWVSHADRVPWLVGSVSMHAAGAQWERPSQCTASSCCAALGRRARGGVQDKAARGKAQDVLRAHGCRCWMRARAAWTGCALHKPAAGPHPPCPPLAPAVQRSRVCGGRGRVIAPRGEP